MSPHEDARRAASGARWLWIALASACLLAGPMGARRAVQQATEAERLLEQAEQEYERGRYLRAVRTYTKLAEEHAETEAGRIGRERSRPSTLLGSKEIVSHGPSSNRVDVGLMGDGYTLKHQDTFDELAEDITIILERQEPFGEYFSYFNFRRFNLVSEDDGVDGFGREENTALGARTLGTIQGHVEVDRAQVLAALDQGGEHDGLALAFVRAGTLGTAYGGIAAVGGRDTLLTIHEWGHAFGGLGDEYDDRTHERFGVPNLPNVSDTGDPERVPWAHWIEARVPGIGTYEGANGQVRDAWRPTASACIMGVGEFFCGPCREALVLSIYALVDPIDSTNFPHQPLGHAASLEVEDRFEFEVQVMQPASHALEVSWWILAEEEVSIPEPSGAGRDYVDPGRLGDRRDRGPLPPMLGRPTERTRAGRAGRHAFLVKARDLEPGRYRVRCRVRDTTRLRGERHPWVLRDEHGLLESEVGWWIRIPER